MPLGIARLNTLSRYIEEAAEEVINERTAITLTVEGDAQISTTQSKFGGSSAVFDGTTDRLYTASESSLVPTDEYCIECWARFDNVTSIHGVFQLSTTAGGLETGNTLKLGLQNQLTEARIYTYGGIHTTSGLGLTANTWYHFALVRNNGTTKLYVDGNEELSVSDTNTYTASNLVIGGVYSTSYLMDGYIDEFRVSDTARYTTGFTPSTTPFTNDNNTLLLVHADGTNGDAVFIDDNGFRAPVGIQAFNDAAVSTTQYQFGSSSFAFDGTTDYLKASLPSFVGTGDFTIEGWVWNSGNDNDGMFHLSTSFPSGTLTGIAVAPRASLNAWTIYTGTGSRTVYSGSPDNSGIDCLVDTWYHAAVVRSSGTTTVYIDGAVVYTDSDSTDYSSYTELMIGGYYSTSFTLNGYIDEFRISDTARYTSTFTPSSTAFSNDDDTLLLLHGEYYDADTSVIFDDNGATLPTYDPAITRPLTITPIGSAQVDTAQKKFGTGSLLPAGGRLEVEMDMPTGDFTIETWNYITNRSAVSGLWEIRGDTNTSHRLALYGGEAGGGYKVLYLTYRDTSGTEQIDIVTSDGTFPDTTWKHCAVTRSGNTFTVWIDGTNRGSATYSSFEMPDTTTLHTGGAVTSGRYFRGNVDDFRVSDTARYSSNFTKPSSAFSNDSNTLFLCHFDGTDGSTSFTDDDS